MCKNAGLGLRTSDNPHTVQVVGEKFPRRGEHVSSYDSDELFHEKGFKVAPALGGSESTSVSSAQTRESRSKRPCWMLGGS